LSRTHTELKPDTRGKQVQITVMRMWRGLDESQGNLERARLPFMLSVVRWSRQRRRSLVERSIASRRSSRPTGQTPITELKRGRDLSEMFLGDLRAEKSPFAWRVRSGPWACVQTLVGNIFDNRQCLGTASNVLLS